MEIVEREGFIDKMGDRFVSFCLSLFFSLSLFALVLTLYARQIRRKQPPKRKRLLAD